MTTETDAGLVERLREPNENDDECILWGLCGKAADRIEALAAARDDLVKYAHHLESCAMSQNADDTHCVPEGVPCTCGLTARLQAIE